MMSSWHGPLPNRSHILEICLPKVWIKYFVSLRYVKMMFFNRAIFECLMSANWYLLRRSQKYVNAVSFESQYVYLQSFSPMFQSFDSQAAHQSFWTKPRCFFWHFYYSVWDLSVDLGCMKNIHPYHSYIIRYLSANAF